MRKFKICNRSKLIIKFASNIRFRSTVHNVDIYNFGAMHAGKTIFYLLFICLIPTTIKAQNSATTTSDSLANSLVDRHKKVNATKLTMPGFRVQIYFGSERSKAQEIRTDFLQAFQETGAYLVYHQPYFKVRVGDFRTRLEAQGFLQKLGDRYTTAFIVQDEVKLP